MVRLLASSLDGVTHTGFTLQPEGRRGCHNILKTVFKHWSSGQPGQGYLYDRTPWGDPVITQLLPGEDTEAAGELRKLDHWSLRAEQHRGEDTEVCGGSAL